MLHRPYIRQEVRQEVENRAQRNNKGQFLDANTHKPITGKYDLGHKPGHEYWREANKAKKDGLTQEEFNERMNNPDLYQIEHPHENRSHAHEMPSKLNTNRSMNLKLAEIRSNEGGKYMGRNTFADRIKVDKATVERCNEVSRNAANRLKEPSSKNNVINNGGRERGDTGPLSHGRESGFKGASSASVSTGMANTPSGRSAGYSAAAQHSASATVGSHGSGGLGEGGHGSGGHSGGHGGH